MSERSVGYVFLMRARVANHYPTHPFQTVLYGVLRSSSSELATWQINKQASLEINGHLAYRPEASKPARYFAQALALRRREKGKPAVRRGRKATDLL
jgi:hypothetical protein